MAVYGAGDSDQLHRTELHRVGESGQREQFAMQSESADRGGDGLGVGGGGRDDPRTAEVLQLGGHVAGRSVDVVVSAQLFGEIALFTAARSRRCGAAN